MSKKVVVLILIPPPENKNEKTNDSNVSSRSATEAYRDNWDRIFNSTKSLN